MPVQDLNTNDTAPGPDQNRISIIYVDDRKDLLSLCKQILEQTGEFSVHTGISVQEGLNFIESGRYDAIVSGHHIPGMDGIAFLKAVREQSGDIPFFLLTSPGNTDAVFEGCTNGADFFPWSDEDPEVRFPALAQKIRQAVQRNQAEITVTSLKSRVESLTHRAAMLEILNGIITEVNNAKNLPDLLKNVLEKSIHLLDFDAGGIYFVDQATRTAHIVHSQNLPAEFIAEVDNVSIEKEPYDTMFINNQPLFLDNYARVSPERYQKYGLFSVATLPLISKGVAIGVLNIASMRRYVINEEEKQTLISISRELASAIDRISAEEENQKIAQNVWTVFHSVDDMVFVLDLDGQIIATNTAAEQRLQYSRREFIGENIQQFLDLEIQEGALRLHKKLLEGTENFSTIPLIAKDGTHIEADTKVTRGQWDNQEVLIAVSRDVTERRQFEEALQKSERRLNEAQHLAQVGSWELDIPTKHLEWSDVIYEIFEIDPLQFGASYEAFLNAIHPDDRKAVDEAYSASLREKTSYKIEHRLLMPDGRIKFVLEQGETKYDSTGNPLSSLGTIQDITGRKIAERSIKEKELRYREIFEGSLDGYVMVDLAGRIIDANQAYCNIVGYSLEELKELENFYEITPEKWRRWEQEEIWENRLFVSGYSGLFEKEYIRKNGEIYPVELQAYVSYGIDGTLQFIWAAVRDITGRRKAEEERERLIATLGESNEELSATYEQLLSAEQELKKQNETLIKSEENLRETNEYLENLISYANVPIIIWDPSFQIKRLNRSFEVLLGRSADEVIGESIKVLFPPGQADRSMRLLQTTLEGVRWETTEIDIIQRDGSIRTLLWNSATLYTKDGLTPLATIAQGYDITERKRLERENDAAIAQIQKNLAYLAILNDEIRNPLAIIVASVSMLDDSTVTTMIIDEAHRIDQMVTQLDQRWIQSEKVLNMLRKHYNITVSPGTDTGSDTPRTNDQEEPEPSEAIENDRKQREIFIEEVQAQLYAILDSMDALIYVADMDTYEMLYANKRLKANLGPLYGEKCYYYMQKRDSPCPFCTSHHLIDENGPTGLYQWEFQSPVTGRWYDCRDRAIRWSDGRIVRMEIGTDITALKKAQEVLRVSEQRVRTLLENIPLGVLLADAETGQFTIANEAICRMLGYPREELISLTLEDIHPPDDYPRVKDVFEQMLTGKLVFSHDIPMMRKDRTVFPADVHSATVELDGRIYLLGIFLDITERMQAEGKVLDYIHRESDILNFLPDAILAIDLEGKVIAWNRAMEVMTGVSAQEMLGKGEYEYAIPFYGERRPILIDIAVLPDDEIENHYQSLRREGRILVASTTDARPRGMKRILWGMATPLTDAEDNLIGAIESIWDITEMKETEDALRLSREKYSTLFRSIPDAIFISDLETGKIIEVNDAISIIYGYSPEELVGKSAFELGAWLNKEHRNDFVNQIKKLALRQFQWVRYSSNPNFISWLLLKIYFVLLSIFQLLGLYPHFDLVKANVN